MTEQEETIVHAPITISVDVDALLKSELGYRTVNIGSWDDPEPDYIPGDGKIIDVVADKLAHRLEGDIAMAVRQAVNDKALEKVDGLIDEVMTTPIKMTSTYGEPRSPEMSLREAMVKAMIDRLEERVDSQGKRQRNDGFGRDGKTYLQWRAEQVGRDILDKDLSKRLSEAAKQIKDSATDLVSKRIAEMLGRGF